MLIRHGVVFVAAFIAGAINSVAGGGTLLSFPALVWIGLPSVMANATSTVAIWPGSFGGMLGYREDMRTLPRSSYLLIIPSAIGGIIGAVLLALTPTALFDRLVPLLILFATLLFMLQEPVQRMIKTTGKAHAGSISWLIGALMFQFFVSLYGGYFGAGIGILMLAAFGILGYTDIHQMNGLKTLLAVFINGVAAMYFIWKGLVVWPEAIVMMVASILGGIWGAGFARRLGQKGVRRIVVVIGFGMALSMLLRAYL
ncbi:MAG: sulfite exporter TauE/SafE family protein [Vicinamibacterales bacterium]|nr:sulfite exporter TauE/SafE family protein [Vicinamibacterales bacterium]